MKVFCLFEQSGTFKNEFRKLGYEADDYDIRNDFGQTDHIIDLYEEIRGGYEGKKSIFDEMTPDDLVLAFFPCIRFETKIMLYFKGKATGQKNWDLEKKLNYSMKLHSELHENYMLLSELVIICLRKNIPLVIENPFSNPNYLDMYWPVKPSIVDRDRRKNGDYQHKPTQYFFINTEPKQNILDDPMPVNTTYRTVANTSNENGVKREVIRSMISPVYANRFIRTYLIEDKQ